MNREKKNLISLIAGIIIVLMGLLYFSLSFSKQIYSGIILSLSALIIGAFLAILGGLRKWK